MTQFELIMEENDRIGLGGDYRTSVQLIAHKPERLRDLTMFLKEHLNSPTHKKYKDLSFSFNERMYMLQFRYQPGYPHPSCYITQRFDKFDQKPMWILLTDFIFEYCNPEGAYFVEQLCFKEII